MCKANDRFIELQCAMKRRHVTQVDLAEELGFDRHNGCISARLSGKQPWRLDEAYKVLARLEIPLSEIFTYFPPDEEVQSS